MGKNIKSKILKTVKIILIIFILILSSLISTSGIVKIYENNNINKAYTENSKIEITKIANGSNHSLAIDSKGNLWTWGSNSSGQLGNKTTENSLVPIQIKVGTKFKEVSAGSAHSITIDEEGNLWAWGSNSSEQLGNSGIGNNTNNSNEKIQTVPMQIKEETKFKEISAGSSHSMAIDVDGNLWTWGSNGGGQLGNGTTTKSNVPIQIKSGTRFKEISAGNSHSMAIDENGNLWVWGYNDRGQLGNGKKEKSLVPIQIKSGTKFKEVFAGKYHSMAIDEEGNLWTWGYNNSGQLGNLTKKDSLIPVKAKEGTKFSQITAGEYHSMAIDEEGNLWTWGENVNGQLGNGGISNDVNNIDKKILTVPTKIKEETKFKEISAIHYHSMAIDIEGNLWVWGLNSNGQLGNGTKIGSNIPIQISIGDKYTVTFKNGTEIVKTEEVYSGESATAPEIIKEGYTLSWDKDFTNVTENITVNAVWTINTSSYKVEYYKQNVEKTEYELVEADSKTLTGTIGQTVTLEEKAYEGFVENLAHSERKISGEITADGNLVLKRYYDRETYDIKINIPGSTGTQQYVYGQVVTLPTNVEKEGYTFGSWYNNESFEGEPITQIVVNEETAQKEYSIKWTPNVYQVTLNTNGGTINSGNITEYTYGEGATLPTDISKEGYTFEGWYDNENLEGEKVTSITATDLENKTYYAKWTINKYTVIFKFIDYEHSTEQISKQEVQHGGSATAPSWTKEGYTLSWDKDFTNVKEDMTVNAIWTINEYTVTFVDGETTSEQKVQYGGSATAPEWTKYGYTVSWDKDFTNVKEDMTVNAIWTISKYTVTFKNGSTINTQTVQHGGSAIAPNWTKEGYTLSWDKDFTNITRDTYITAIWTINEYTVTFVDGETTSQQTVQYGGSATAPEWTKKGYRLSWDKNFTSVKEDMTVNAIWIINEYKVTFVDGETTSEQIVEHGKSATAPAWTKEGYRLSWDKDFTNITEDITVNAIWTIKEYTVIFRDGMKVSEQTVQHGKSATAPNWTKEGYTLSWDKDFTNITEYTTVNAVWTPNVNTPYRVEYYKQNIEKTAYELVEEDSKTLNGATGQTVTAEEKTYEGFVENLAHSERKISGEILADGTLVLKRYYDRNSYNISYELNEGTATDLTNTYIYGKGVTLQTNISKEGHIFEGWYDNEGFTGSAITSIGTNEIGDKTFYAKWTINTSSLNINPQSGSVQITTAEGNSETITESKIFTGNYNKTLTYSVPTKENNVSTQNYTVNYNYNGATSGNEKVEDTATKTRTISYTFNEWQKSEPFYGTLSSLTESGTYTYPVENGVTSTITANYTSVTNEETTKVTLPTPQKTGYTFEGWYSDEALTTKVGNAGEEYTPITNTTLYAKWTINEYTVTFVDGETTSSQTVQYGGSATAPSWTKEGYTLSWDKDFTNITEDTTVNAVWTPNTNTPYRVEYYKQNITRTAYELVEEDSKTLSGTTGQIVTAEEKTYEGFVENLAHSERKISGEITADGSLVLKRYYDRKTYTITLNKPNPEGTGTIPVTEEHVYGETITLPTDIEKEGYTFGGWYDNEDFEGDPITQIVINEETEQKEYSIKWIPKEYTVTFKDGEVTNEQTVQHGQSATAPSWTKEGYTLSWDKDFTNITEDTTINAIWTINEYTVTFVDGETTSSQTVQHGGSATAPSWTKEGYTLSWDKDFTNITEDTSINAVWTPNIYKVTLNTNGGIINSGDIVEYTYGEGATLPTDISKEGYTFEGWYDNENFEGEKVTNITATDLEDKTYYTKWTINTSNLNINPNGGSIGITTAEGNIETITESKTFTGNYNTALTYSTPTKQNDVSTQNYTVNYNYNEATSGNEKLNDTATKTTTVSYTFNEWQKLEPFYGTLSSGTYTYPAGNGVTSTIIANYTSSTNEETTKVTLPIPQKTGSTFEGWYSDEELTTKVGNAGEEYTLGADSTLYAKWKTNEYTVTFKDGEQTSQQTVQHGGSATAPTWTKQGYTLSWDKEFTNITEDTTVNAEWIPNTNTPYKVEHYLRNADIEVEGYDLCETETFTGKTGEKVTAIPKNYEGFIENKTHPNRKAEGIIQADGSLVLRLYYERNNYNIIYNLNGGTPNSVLTNKYTYGKEVYLSNRVTKQGSTFLGWYDNENFEGERITKIGPTEIGNKTFYAKWSNEGQYYVTSNDYNINTEEGYVTKVNSKTNVSSLLNSIQTNGSKKILNLKNEEVTGNELVGTGYKVQITFEGETKEYEIAVKGDIDGNGMVSVTDLSMINQVLANKIKLTGIKQKAADLDYNGGTTVTDLSMMNQALTRKF